ncbi:MAG: hypothetical protein NTV76_15215 [Pseudomonas sp.]|nr:hypothetical protein [Pseudomonas sp.]
MNLTLLSYSEKSYPAKVLMCMHWTNFTLGHLSFIHCISTGFIHFDGACLQKGIRSKYVAESMYVAPWGFKWDIAGLTLLKGVKSLMNFRGEDVASILGS